LSEIAYRERLLQASEPVSDSVPDMRLVPNWFAVFTSPRHEKRVQQHFSQRDVENYLPIYRSPRKWRNGLKVVLDLPIFPGYIFVHIKRTERVRVLEVPGVLAIVGGTANRMTPLPETEVEALRSGLHLRQVSGCASGQALLPGWRESWCSRRTGSALSLPWISSCKASP